MKFSSKELYDLAKAWVILSIAFAIALGDFGMDYQFGITVLISALTVGLGFMVHEMAHKYMAQRYHAWAEFRAYDNMLFFALFLAIFVKVIFAAPGAVYIRGGHIDYRRNGKISLAGPLSNFVLAFLFLPLISLGGIMASIGSYGFLINSWLGLFNLVPFGNFDGSKILAWNKLVYVVMVAIGFVLVFGRGTFWA